LKFKTGVSELLFLSVGGVMRGVTMAEDE